VSPAAKQPKPKPKAATKAKAAKPKAAPREPDDERVLELEHAPPELSRVILHRLARGR